MTIKAVIDSVSLRVVGTVPAAVFSSQDQVAQELRDLAQDAAEDIAASAEWRDLTRVATMTGAASFPKPADYDRMCKAQGVQNQGTGLWGYHPFQDVSEYIAAMNGHGPVLDPGGWIILDGEFKFWPAPSGTATFPYISNLIVQPENGSPRRARFEADTDSFVLPERLLALGLIWRYRAQKGLDYSEDMETYGIALSQAQDRDKGARVIRPDRVRARFPGARLSLVNRGW